MLLDWEYYAPDTWAAESADLVFLIKKTDDKFVFVIGTLEEATVTGAVDTLSDAQAIANRYSWIVNNVTPDHLNALINKL